MSKSSIQFDETEETPNEHKKHGLTPNLKLFEAHQNVPLQNIDIVDETSPLRAMDRLIKDLKEVYKSVYYKSKHYGVDIVDEDLYHWKIRMFKMDSDSKLATALNILSEAFEKKVIVELEFRFDSNYPFSPPFIRILGPHIRDGYVTEGGGLCMKLLTKQGWSPAYSIESLIIQIYVTLVYGQAQAVNANSPSYTLDNARRGFQDAANLHQQYGW